MNVLVTGANGFIGRALCKRMLADGYQVRGAVRDGRQMTVLPSGVERVQIGNIGPKTDWSKALAGIDGIVHLAARVHVMRENAADPLAAFRQVNVDGTERLAQQAAEVGVKRLVYISSVKVNGEETEIRGRRSGRDRSQRSEVRGQEETEVRGRRSGRDRNQRSEVRGQEETEVRGRRSEVRKRQKSEVGGGRSEVGGRGSVSKEFFSEEDVPDPQDPYAVSKWEAEQVLRDVAVETGLEVVILRPPLVYGPFVKANFLRLFKIVKLGIPLPFANINNRRSLIYLGNLIDSIIICILQKKAAGQTYLVSDGDDISTQELIRRIAYSMGGPARLYFFPSSIIQLVARLSGKSAMVDRLVSSLSVNTSKIKHDLDWNPPYTMDEGLKETAEWYLNREKEEMLGEYFGKRILDYTLALLLLIIFSIPMMIIGLFIKMTSTGPVLYWSGRVGKSNLIFKMPKFRTMRVDTPAVATHLMKDPDVYLTPIGAFLRKLSLDEFPQLFSVLKGDMSFVGPRPALFNQYDLVELRTRKGIHNITPGLTGWAQINGRDELPIPVKVEFDDYYFKHRSFFLDLKILWMTFVKVVKREGVTH